MAGPVGGGGERRKRVCIVGSGAAGMACAWSLSRFPDRFDVHVFEREGVIGGAATSDTVTSQMRGDTFVINDQVQVSSTAPPPVSRCERVIPGIQTP